MNPQQLIPTIIATLHNLFTAAWIGGMLVLAFAVLPALRTTVEKGKDRLPIATAIQKRLRFLTLISIVGLAVTGLLMTKRGPAGGGLFQFGTPYDSSLAIKHILMILMVLTAAARSVVNQKLVKTPSPKTEKISAALLLLNILFGIAVLFLSALLATLAMG
jgi:putative copper export protein